MGETYPEMRAAFERYLHDDCIWANQGLPAAHGKIKILEFLRQFADRTGLAAVHGEVRNIASVPGTNTVLTERHERWTDQGGAVLVESLPVMGAFEVAGGKIKAWRDYFDPSKFAHLMRD